MTQYVKPQPDLVANLEPEDISASIYRSDVASGGEIRMVVNVTTENGEILQHDALLLGPPLDATQQNDLKQLLKLRRDYSLAQMGLIEQ